MNLRFLAVAMLLTLASHSVGNAQESKPWWNPFATTTTETSAVVRDSKEFGAKPSGLKMPEFKLPNWSKSKATAKKMWDSTVDFMNPFNDAPKTQTNGYQPQKQTKSGKGMFGWMTKEETTETPPSVSSWLANPRPGYDR